MKKIIFIIAVLGAVSCQKNMADFPPSNERDQASKLVANKCAKDEVLCWRGKTWGYQCVKIADCDPEDLKHQ